MAEIKKAVEKSAPAFQPKVLETGACRWEIPTVMTVVADNKKRVTLRLAKPGDRFDVQISPGGKFILTKLEPVRETPPAKVRIEQRGQYHVGVLDRPIDEEALKEALADFP
jgi:hypothetical protein